MRTTFLLVQALDIVEGPDHAAGGYKIAFCVSNPSPSGSGQGQGWGARLSDVGW